MLCELYKRKLDIYFLVFNENYANCIRSYKCSQPKPVWESSHSMAMWATPQSQGSSSSCGPGNLEAPTSPPAPSSAGNPAQRVTCTETEPRLSKRPLFYSSFPSSKPSFWFSVLHGITITERVHEQTQGYHLFIKTRMTQDCQSTSKTVSVKISFSLKNYWTSWLVHSQE